MQSSMHDSLAMWTHMPKVTHQDCLKRVCSQAAGKVVKVFFPEPKRLSCAIHVYIALLRTDVH